MLKTFYYVIVIVLKNLENVIRNYDSINKRFIFNYLIFLSHFSKLTVMKMMKNKMTQMSLSTLKMKIQLMKMVMMQKQNI